MTKEHPTDLELLAVRAEDLADRSIGVHVDRTQTEQTLTITPSAPAHLASALAATWDGVRHVGDLASPRAALLECERLLTAEGWNVSIGESLVYLIDPAVSFAAEATMHRSDQSSPRWLRLANPGNWEPAEWHELVDGRLGPWAMATLDRRVVSITHTPIPLTDRSVEAGAWTDPEFRGRGYAAAVTAEWADIFRPSGQLLFYSTTRKNRSSQRVAARLGLRLIGHQWLLRNRDLEYDPGVHPLSEVIAPIETNRLRLESMSTDFLSAFLDGDIPKAQRLVDYHVPSDFSLLGKRAAVQHRLGLIATDRAQHPWMCRAIRKKSDGALVGHISFHHKAPDPDLDRHGEAGAELGYTIEPAHRRQGYAKESAIGMMEWAFMEFGVRSFVLTIGPDNLASLRTAESMGFRVIGEQEDPTDGTELVLKAEIECVLQRKDAQPRPTEPPG